MIYSHKFKFDVKWQKERFNLSEEEAINKIKEIKYKCGKTAKYIYDVKWQMERFNLTEEEAINKIKEIKTRIITTQKNMSEFEYKAMCSKNPEHWIKKGYSAEESKDIALKQLQYMQQSFQEQRKNNPRKYKDKDSTTIGYWINKGFTEEEAKLKLKERQSTFSLEKCIKRYGLEEGTKKLNDRQIKWQTTLNNKTDEEKQRINNLKGITLENMIRKWGVVEGTEKYHQWFENHNIGYSNISQELFYCILSNIHNKNKVKFATHNNEKRFEINKKSYALDFYYNKYVIEFNGDIFHANPLIYKEQDHPNPYRKELTSKDIWEYDKIKNQHIINKGYRLLIVWENEYRKNKDKIINDCLSFLNIKE